MLEWLLVGGGIHGTHLSIMLTQAAGVPVDRLRVIDPHPDPLAVWNRCTANVGMSYLRSPLVHHIGRDPMELWQFAGAKKDKKTGGLFQGRYKRPSYDLFQRHCRRVVESSGVLQTRVQARALRVQRRPNSWRVETSRGDLEARRLVLCIGASEQPRWPLWAEPFRHGTSAVHHLFAPGFHMEALAGEGPVAVVGAGMSGVQAALRLARERPGRVHLLAREPVRRSEFDSDPCYIGDKCLAGFSRESHSGERRRRILAARRPGSVTPEIHRALVLAIRQEALNLHLARVRSLRPHLRNGCSLSLSNGTTLHTSSVVLATGFEPHRPGGPLVDTLIAEEGLPTAPCGYPIVSTSLEWAPDLHVTGPLAELEIGPVSRNIIGARHAAERLAAIAATSPCCLSL